MRVVLIVTTKTGLLVESLRLNTFFGISPIILHAEMIFDPLSERFVIAALTSGPDPLLIAVSNSANPEDG